MECTWDTALLNEVNELPLELLEVIRHGSDQQYLDSLTRTATSTPGATYIILSHCEDILAHICASLRRHATFASTIATLGRIVPYASFVSPIAISLLRTESFEWSHENSHDECMLYLLGLFRLLRHDRERYCKFVRPSELALHLEHPTSSVRYLIIRILQIHLNGADAWFETMVQRYIGADSPDGGIHGLWDEKLIDYRFLTLWEEDRRDTVLKLIRSKRDAASRLFHAIPSHRSLSQSAFDSSVCSIGGVLLPRGSPLGGGLGSSGRLVSTPTIARNLRSIAQSLKHSQPVLLSGPAGSGKTLLIRHAAAELGKLASMVTLHLNEQSDAKLLLGIYTTGETPGSFIWKPGVLTTAVQEGRWVLIEDLDRAPTEVMGVLLPLIENQQLYIPSRKETIVAAEGFKLVASVRTFTNYRNEEVSPITQMLGQRHWRSVHLSIPPVNELGQIVQELYPVLQPFVKQLMAVYDRLLAAQLLLVTQSKTGVARPISARDFMKWCQRVALNLQKRSTFDSHDIDNFFLEAIDCFVSALPLGQARTTLAGAIAEELRINPQRRDHLLAFREVRYESEKTRLNIGRHSLPRRQTQKRIENTFSANPHTARMLERVTAAVLNREPLLLVGETGVGKTTAVQHLASHLGKKLVPFNLSQQSEASDLLGGFKPVNARSLLVPMKDDFDELFAEGFSPSKNKQFLEMLNKQMARSNWRSVCKLWRQALSMVEQQRSTSPFREGEAPSKKRKIDSKRSIDFERWRAFASRLDVIEQRIASGDDGLAFTFVEGNIIKAVRDGDWVLLDEINLAAPDTLESITDLLDPESPSLLLTEAGNIERVTAHPEFRVFAAMNPATDVGKKDLPPGIRSRFTEIYVESPDKDAKCLQSIVQAYLPQESLADPSLASDVTKVYQTIVSLVEENRLVDGAGQKPHFSLRTLTRTLSYSKRIQQICSIRRALYEGFQMSFMTFLDDESARLVDPVIEKQLFGKRTNIRAELQKALRKPTDGHEYVQGHPESKHWIRKGALDVEDQPHYIITPFVRSNLENLVRAASTRQFPVLIQGPTSSGKTSMIEFLAKRSGHRFVRINNHEHTDLQEYLGTYVSGSDGRLQFQEGVLVKALREGHWVVLDELNLAPTDVLEALNRLLDDNRELLVPETQEVVRPHTDFMLFATQNPAGLYGGRKTLSRAFRNRFLELHFDDIPVHELQEILHRRTQLPESRSKRIVNVYRELSVLRQENRLFEQKSFATLRDLFRWALRPNDTIHQLAQNGYMLLCERVRKEDERLALKAVIEKVMSANGPRVQIDEAAMYSRDCAEIQGFVREARDGDVVWTSAMRRLYVLVSRAIQNTEPVLLVGETGCGKTTVCQMLADALSKNLHMLNAHQNTETGDLIGSQRPVRNRAGIELDLRQHLLNSALVQASSSVATASTDQLLQVYDQEISRMDKGEKRDYVQSAVHATIQSLRTRFHALFEWVDGSLVQALRDGEFFLLDEISLADDSVLERLNSVLEPSRTILLAEKGSLDSSVIAAPGFQFFATMNPGGDYGKRELSPALRNRFTEIWVPALSDETDILQIVRAKLVPAAQPYAQAMVSFASWFKGRFNTSANSAVSIRDTLAWVQFVNMFAKHDVEASVVHGAAMVYIDTLGANPAGLMTLSMSSLDRERNVCLEELGRCLRVDSRTVYETSIEVELTPSAFTVGPFTLSRASKIEHDLGFNFQPLATRSNAMRVLRALQLSKPVMLEGSPGVGKTALVTAISQAVGMPLTRINLSDQTDLLDLFGSDTPVEGEQTGTFVWRDAPFLRAMKRGEWVLLDEMNLASQSVLEGLNACLDHRGEVFVPELGQTFSRHPDFRLFAAQNPHHQGGGRKGLPASFVNRFTVVYADSFKEADLRMICGTRYPSMSSEDVAKAVSFVTRLSQEVSEERAFGSNGAPWEFNLRDISRWLSLAVSNDGLLKAGTARDFVESLFTQRFRTGADQSSVRDILRTIYGADQSACDLFTNLSPRCLQIGLGILPRDPMTATQTKANMVSSIASSYLRIAESAMLCIQRAWPVILSGSSGAGKTALIEQLAAATGARIWTLSMNAETDSLDLIGGYEQHDPRRQATHAITQLQEDALRHAKTTFPTDRASEAIDVLRALQNVQSDTTAGGLQQLAKALEPFGSTRQGELDQIIDTPQQVDKARFEWIDGPLVEAMQQGHWLVLDNANLCSPSVLDRLNSLLEPNGVLMLNEHTGSDGTPRVLRPHPDFRVFLTIDPRLGELSRAMRNRAVELHLAHEVGKDVALVDPFSTESTIARFRAVKTLEVGSSRSGEESRALVAVVRDHFALNDEALVPRLLQQLKLGLYRETIGIPWDEYHQIVTKSTPSVERLHQLGVFYRQCQLDPELPTDYAGVQTLHPLNNQALAQQSEKCLSKALSLAAFFDLNFSLATLAEELSLSKSDRRVVQRLDRFLKKNLQHSASPSVRAPVLFDTLYHMLHTIVTWCHECIDLNSTAIVQAQPQLTYLIAFCHFFYRSMAGTEPDSAIHNACLALGKKLCNTVTMPESLSEQLSRVFSRLLPGTPPPTGHAFVPLWKALRPPTPSSYKRLQAVFEFETIIKKFDDAAFQQGVPFRSVVNLRQSFHQALSLTYEADTDLDSLVTKASEAMHDTLSSDISDQREIRPHFASTFELICQQLTLLSLGGITVQYSDIIPLEALAGRTTLETLNRGLDDVARSPQQILALLQSTTARTHESSDFSVSNDVLPHMGLKPRILQDVATLSGVSLGALAVLDVEVTNLGYALANHAHLTLRDSEPGLGHSLEALLRTVLQAISQAEELGHLRDLSDTLLTSIDDGNTTFDATQSKVHAHVGGLDKVLRSSASHLAQTASYFGRSSSAAKESLSSHASAWIALAVAFLNLFVPAVPSDPVMEAQVQSSVHERNRTGLEANLGAVQSFSTAWTGEINSLRSRSIQAQIDEPGPTPDKMEICRPPKSQLLGLVSELNGLMRILQPLRDANPSDNLLQAFKAVSWENVGIVRSRLADMYRAYADIATPVISFIDCLALGRRLSHQAEFRLSSRTDLLGLDTITPLRCAEVDDWLSDTTFVRSFESCTSSKARLYWLSVVAVRSSVRPTAQTSQTLQSAISHGFQRFYHAWRDELDEGQKAAAAKSSLYRYRGGSEVEEEIDTEELENLFPEFENGSEPSRGVRESTTRRQSLAPILAKLYHLIHATATVDHVQLLDLLVQHSQLNMTIGSQSDECSDVTQLMLVLAQVKSSLGSKVTTQRSSNIYKDPNIEESRRLVTTVKSTSRRFNAIHSAWPDHAVPIDVLRICNQILEFGYSEPLMKYLPLVEKLHSTISEWQKVASSEYSASSSLEEVTNLIVSWRQLELSTWAALFDHEDKQCVESSASWWYIAYETIIVASNELHESSTSLQSFAEELTATMGSFLTHCGLGEFKTRLQMLRDFRSDLSTHSQGSPDVLPVHDALAGVIAYYSYFEPSVEQSLSRRRADLEREVRNVIQLASWKDRNIETLKSSSKSSHKKLFKIVRKYRQVLSDPVSPLVQGEFPSFQAQSQLDTNPMQTLQVTSEVAKDSDLVKSQSWHQRPAHLADPQRNAQALLSMKATLSNASLSAVKIEKFLQELEKESSELRRATPSISSEVNKGLIQHLKTRKRRLLADVLKDVRLMGFQANLSEDILTRQRNVATVLAATPLLGLHSHDQQAAIADHEFLRLLHVIPKMRDAAAKPSDDLTPAEVTRCKILIESMLHACTEERKSLARSLRAFTSLRQRLGQLRTFSSSQTPLPVEAGEQTATMLHAKVSMTLNIIRALVECIHSQADFARKNYSSVVDALNGEAANLEVVRQGLVKLDLLPDNITSAEHRQLAEHYVSVSLRLERFVEQVGHTHPELEPTLSHLRRWCAKSKAQNGHLEVHLSQEHSNDSVGAMLSTASRLESLVANAATAVTKSRNVERSKAWLLDDRKLQHESLSAFTVENIDQDLSDLLRQISYERNSIAVAELSTIGSTLAPIFNAYETVINECIVNACACSASMSRMAYQLATSFTNLASQGFCTPPEKGSKDEQQSGDVETGTGLGDGEGGEDISKDIKADEDLSELAQEPNKGEKEQDMEAEKDAVDMADEDLQGEFDEGQGEEEENGDGEDAQSNAELDEEAGEVGEDDAGAADEKMWDDGKADQKQEKETQNAKGEKSDDIAAAEEQELDGKEAGGEEETDEPDHGGDDVEIEQGGPESEQVDPQAQMEDNLDLPEDMAMDGEKGIDDEMSDIDAGFGDDNEEEKLPEDDPVMEDNLGEQNGDEEIDINEAKEPSEPEHDSQDQADEDANSDIAMLDKEDEEQKAPHDGLVSGEDGTGQEQDVQKANTQPSATEDAQAEDQENNGAESGDGTDGGTTRAQDQSASERQDESGEEQRASNFKQLGDMLNEWYDQQREIQSATERTADDSKDPQDVDMANAQFEHLPENVESDMQALGAASTEQSRALNHDNSIAVNDTEPEDLPMPKDDHIDKQANDDEDLTSPAPEPQTSEDDTQTSRSKAMIGTYNDTDMVDAEDEVDRDDTDSEELTAMDERLTKTHISPEEVEPLTLDAARHLWAEHEGRTRNMALVLTEHLRLILQPTQATKMRGDFRTGKRLNIKKIIPYIASSYKRDKIWMRRSVPHKRAYQIMLAIDDSKSMTESASQGLAFDTLALVGRALAMLEVGDVCVVGFGERVTVAHDFGMPFTSEAGAEVFRAFSFAQHKTDVRKLLESSIETFRAARLKATGSRGDLWQLQLIVSDGVCEDHPSIRQLVRQAHEEQIMVVFIVIDSTAPATTVVDAAVPRQSILDLQTAEFTKDAAGEMQLKMVKYLDTFPFRYYLIVRDVQELPGVLAGALRQWFAEVVETGY